MDRRGRPTPSEVQSQILQIYTVPVGGSVAFLWTLAIVYLLFGRTANRGEMVLCFLVMNVGLTVVGVGYVAHRLRLATFLASQGVETVAQVIDRGKVNFCGRQRVACQFDADGKRHRSNVTLSRKEARGLEAGATLAVLFDPLRPRSCMALSEIVPTAPPPVPPEREPVSVSAPGLGGAQSALPFCVLPTKRRAEKGQRSAWGSIIIGFLITVAAFFEYHRLTRWEEEGGWITVWYIEGFFYDMFGKWGAVGILFVAGLLTIFAGVRRAGKAQPET